jgi:preprotein translocase subunit SecA
MITKSIERAQKKVEENNFGIRKNLLEYDDVMNAQRDVIYKRRNHALFGERLSIDLDAAIFDVCSNIATQHIEKRNFEAFKIEVMTHLAIEPEISPEEFAKADQNTIAESLYNHAKDFYTRKMAALREHMMPTFSNIWRENGDKVDNIVIPFTDGIRGMQLYVNLREAVENDAHPVIQALEKNITLSMIDDAWKDHLRAMDDLRTSVRMASYEQKDPLLIYKFEAFNLFKQMLLETNRNIISFLLRAGIPVQEAPPQAARRPQPQTDLSKLKVNKDAVDAAGQDYAADENDYYNDPATAVKRMPVQAGPKIGRNDPCPCGSGKKYKNCHGKGV